MAIAKVILNGTTLIDATAATASAEDIIAPKTAMLADGVMTTGTGKYQPVVEAKRAVPEKDIELVYPGEELAMTRDITISATTTARTMTTIQQTNVSLLKTLNAAKKYHLYGGVRIVDYEGNVLSIVPISDSLDVTDTTVTKYINIIPNDYITELRLLYFYADNSYSKRIDIGYSTGTFGFTAYLRLVESDEEVDGLASVVVEPPEFYGVYTAAMLKNNFLISSGSTSTSYKYTSSAIRHWCDSFSSCYSRQFEGINFSGSFYFNNLTSIAAFAFARAWNGAGTSDTGKAYLYFPSVSSIADRAFLYNGLITSVSAPVCTYFGTAAFLNCGIVSASFPECSNLANPGIFSECARLKTADFSKCTSIGNYTFANCTSLSTINFPVCTTIGEYAFYNCKSLTTISFPSCTSIRASAFRSCSSMTTVNFPECLSIESCAFSACTRLSSISFPKCTSIGSYAFWSCGSLTTMNFPECTRIYDYAFAYAGQYNTATIMLPECSSIGSSAFTQAKIISISIPKCTSFGERVFAQCSYLTSIECFGTIISNYLFVSCYQLSVVSLPSCTTLNNYAFQYCSRLLSVYLMGSSYVNLLATSPFYATPISTSTSYTSSVHGSIYVPASMLSTYKNMTNWVLFSNRFVGV